MAIQQWKLHIDNILQRTLKRLEIINFRALQMKEVRYAKWVKIEVLAVRVLP